MKDYKNDLEEFDDILEMPDIDFNDSILFKGFSNLNQDSKKELKLSKEINKRKIQISHLFNEKFGKHFLNQKPEQLKILEKRLAQFLFNPNSKFLSKLPKLQRKILQEKKISVPFLRSKIDIGGMVFYELKEKNNKLIINNDNAKEKMLSISKNFSYTPVKDIIGTAFYKVKFWDKNSKRLNHFIKTSLRNKYAQLNEHMQDLIEENELDNEMITENDDNNINIIRDFNSQRERTKINSVENNKNLGSKSNFYSLTEGNKYINNSLDKKDNTSLDIKFDNSTSIKLRDKIDIKKGKRYSITKSVESEKFLNTNTPNSKTLKDLIPKLSNFNNLSRNYKINSPNLFIKSNTFRKNLNNINDNINERYLNTVSNFNKSKNKNYNKSIYKLYNGTISKTIKKYSSRKVLVHKNDIILRKKNLKFKNNINDQISQLNEYTNKCNTELIKLIDGNNDDNFKERKKVILNKNKLDIKEILIGKKKSKKDNEDEQIMKENEKEKDTIKNLIKVAIYDTGDNFGEADPKVRERNLKRNVNHISDEDALNMVERLIERHKLYDFREILKENDKNDPKRKNNINLLRQKVENNYERMLKLKNLIIIDRRKVFKSQKSLPKHQK